MTRLIKIHLLTERVKPDDANLVSSWSPALPADVSSLCPC